MPIEQNVFANGQNAIARTAPRNWLLLFCGMMLITINMRPAFTSIGPLLEMIRTDLRLSSTMAGVLGTMPVLAFGMAAPLAPYARFFGIERSLMAALLLTLLGILLRSASPVPALFAGTFITGAAVGTLNVLLPSLIKRDFPNRITTMTSIYAAVMSISSAFGSGIAVPLAGVSSWGWRLSLAAWALPILFAVLCWLPQLKYNAPQAHHAAVPGNISMPLWRSALAWQVTAFMCLQSTIFYALMTWLPAFLQTKGMSPKAAGWYLGLFQILTTVVGPLMSLIIARCKDQRLFGVIGGFLGAIGSLGLLFLPGLITLWVTILGIGCATCFILALSFFSLRARNYSQAAALAGMSQTFAFLIAAAVPPFLGLLHDRMGNWDAYLPIIAGVALLQSLAGWRAGRAVTL